MEIVIGIGIGLVVGMALAVWFNQQQLKQKDKHTENQMRRLREELELAHENRLKETVRSLQTDYERQAAQKIQAAQQEQVTEFENRLNLIQADRDRALEQKIAELNNQHQDELHQIDQSHRQQMQEATDAIKQEYEDKLATVTPQETEVEEYVPSEPFPFDEILDATPEDDREAENIAGEVATPERVEGDCYADLIQSIHAWGKTESIAYIPQLRQQLYAPNEGVRTAVATALGQIAAHKPARFEIMQIIEYLGSLSKDPNATVRQAAIAALGQIKSEKVIPLLQQGLRDSNSAVVQTASDAIARYKAYPRQLKPKLLPRNAKPVDEA
jgi:hypothetical protein